MYVLRNLILESPQNLIESGGRALSKGMGLAGFRCATGGQCGGRVEGEACRRLVTFLTDFDFVGHPLKGSVIQGSWIPPQPQGVEFD